MYGFGFFFFFLRTKRQGVKSRCMTLVPSHHGSGFPTKTPEILMDLFEITQKQEVYTGE